MNHVDLLGAGGSSDKGSEAHQTKKIKELEARARRFRVSLRESEERFKTLCNLIPETICCFDLEGLISYWNSSAQQLFGWTSAELLGKSVFEVVLANLPADSPLRELISSQGASGKLPDVSHEVRFAHKNGQEFYGILTLAEVRSENSLSFVCSIVPKSEPSHLDAARMDEPAAPEHPYMPDPFPMGCYEALCDFWLNVSHEIRKPLSGITGMLQLAMKTELSKEQREYLEMLQITSDNMMTLINDIIDFSKIETGQFDLEQIDFDLYSTLEAAINAFASHASDKGLSLECRISPDVPNALRGDPGRFRKIILNLLDNAVKYTPSGYVHVSCDQEQETADRVQLHIRIEDSGIGIEPEKLASLFDIRQPWQSANHENAPSRLGLSICRELAELMDGRIWAESEPGKGTVFHVTCCFIRRIMPKPMPRERLHASLTNLRVLYVDSSATDRIIMNEMLSGRVHRYEDAGDWESALLELSKAKTTNQPYHLIIVDSMIPPSHVFEFVSYLKSGDYLRETRVMVLTSFGQRGDAAKCRELGISAYLLKPIKQSELIEAIQKVLTGERDAFTDESQLITRHTIREDRERLKFNFLVVEDNPLNQEITVRTIAKHGHGIEVADQSRKVMEYLATDSFDVVLINTQLASMDAFEITRKIRRKERQTGHHVPIIALMDPGSPVEQSLCLDSGMDNYVLKPLKHSEIHTTVQQTIDLVRHRTKRNPKVVSHSESEAPFQFSKILKMFYGDMDLLRQVFKLFNEHYPTQIEALQKADAERNPARLIKAVGRLKTSAQNFGESLLLQKLGQIEKLGQASELVGVKDAIAELDALIAQFVAFITKNLKKPH